MEEITKHLIRRERFDCQDEYEDLKFELHAIEEKRKLLKNMLTEFFNVYDSLEDKSKLEKTRNFLLIEWCIHKFQLKSVQDSLISVKKSLKDFDRILN